MQVTESAMETRSEDRNHWDRQLPRAEGEQHDRGKLHALEEHSDVDAPFELLMMNPYVTAQTFTVDGSVAAL
jgi:hypothetical protein